MSKNEEIDIDLGYGWAKIHYNGKYAKFLTAIMYYSDVGVAYGDNNVYDYEGDKYYVGSGATSEAFATNEYKFKYKFDPLLIYHVLSQFDKLPQSRPITVNAGLALVDWAHKDEYIQRISSFEVNGEKININVNLKPQGAGVADDWVYNDNNGEYPERLHILDIGHNTINSLHFINGKPDKANIKTYPGHGVSSIVKPFNQFLENTFSMQFSEQESIGIFNKGSFKYNGTEQSIVSDKIQELKSQFVTKLFQSVLVNDKKLMGMSDVVLIAGGGAYLLQDTEFPPNVKFVSTPYEYSNVRGYPI